METNLERKTLGFSKGITNIPSDLLSEDGELADCEGFVCRDGEMKPIQRPVLIGAVEGKLLYVHKMADYENLISYSDSNIHWYRRQDDGTSGSVIGSFEVGEVYAISSVGNTLVCATDKGIHYLLFKGGKYKDLGTELPKPSVDFSLMTSNTLLGDDTSTPCDLEEVIDTTYKLAQYDNTGNLVSLSSSGMAAANYFAYEVKNDVAKKQTFKDAAQGHAAQQVALCKKENAFVHPFFLRYALRLFDGSYARISNPIACYPCITRNNYFVPVIYDEGSKNYVQTAKETHKFLMYPYYSKLIFFAQISGVEEWADIVKELVVFASDDVTPYYVDDGWSFVLATETNETAYHDLPARAASSDFAGVDDGKFKWTSSSNLARDVILPKFKTAATIINELKSKSQFYKLFSVKVSESKYFVGSNVAPIEDGVVTNLTSQEQLTKDDYYGWTNILAKNVYTYNKRINLFNIERKPFKGFDAFNNTPQVTGDKYKFTYYVHIVTADMDTWVKSDERPYAIGNFANSWFFYPDTNATELVVWDSVSQKGMKILLENHPLLNGAYSFANLPTENTFSPDSTVGVPTVDEDAKEYIDSQIFTSVVNNPFVFEASGDNTVGTGRILGIAANTEAVSQGQFGQYPLMVFTTEGVYGMAVNSEGLYSSVYPISREAMLEDSPLVPTDSLVYFVSQKGLMAASGGSVACVSEQLKGKTTNFASCIGDCSFLDFLKDSLIAYDYRDSLLRIFHQGKSYQYIYNKVGQTFSSLSDQIDAQAVVNDYPDNLIEDTKGNVYSLTKKLDINTDSKVDYSGMITTRPLKFGGSIKLKSLRAIKHLVDTTSGKITLELWGSNNCNDWCKLSSLGGKAWKYFVFRYTLSGFKANDSFAGSIVEVQNRRNDKMR